ncbi:hypothetical protein B0H63DRAFT_527070 [Podospora didyma]|uniref:Uncharacterized protein n=1 Tax=Podospora didyma TaxID=330526 RepID=A0AAE0K961_9PEZI|nr:hypothetical protein B0H63DRAFT_527070 [Podospora didyma]
MTTDFTMLASKIWSLAAIVATASALNLTQFITFPGIRNVGSGLCLQAFGDPAGTIAQRTCDNSNIQQLWSTLATSAGSNIYQIQSAFMQCMWTASDNDRKVILGSATVAGSYGIPQMPVFGYKAIYDELATIRATDNQLVRICRAGANIA